MSDEPTTDVSERLFAYQGMSIDLRAVENRLLRRVLEERLETGNGRLCGGGHTDHSEERKPYDEHTEYTEHPSHADHTDKHTENRTENRDGWVTDHTEEHSDHKGR